ncbi:MAG: pyrroline-5-carboxylate reductase [Cyclobacteriaceae bacterium]
MSLKIAVIGGGNLGIAIAEGLIDKNYCQPSDLYITRRKVAYLDGFKLKGVNVGNDNQAAAKAADVIILAVKPYQVEASCSEIKGTLKSGNVVVSVATGVDIETMSEALGNHKRVYRAMPNTAIAIGESMTCVCGADDNGDDLDMVCSLFNTVGETIVIREELMNAATVLGACGIAYAMRFIRAATQGGIEIGFHADVAQKIAAQTVKGAADLLIKHGSHPESEIDKVTTPQGCTIAGLNEMEHQGFSSAMIKGVLTSYGKI